MGKLVYIIVDGMGDFPIRNLNNKTPLDYAYKPNLSLLLKHAAYAFPSVLGKLAPQSDAGVLADLGYEPTKYCTGRGWFECLGLGMQPEDGDLSVRVNFGEVKNRQLVSVRTYLSKEELLSLENEINSKVKLPVSFAFKSGEGYRAGLVLRKGKEKFSAFVSNNEPGYTVRFYPKGKKLSFASSVNSKKIKKISSLRKEARKTAQLLNLFVDKATAVIKSSAVYKKRVIDREPLPSYLFLRDAAVKDPKLPDINKQYKRSWAAVVGMPLEKGIATAAGMKVMGVSESQIINEDLSEKTEKVSRALSSFDCVYLHIKQTDSVSHLGKYTEKYAIIEAMDRILIARLAKELDIAAGDSLVLTCDHATSSELKRHTNSNIPVLMVNKKFGQNRDFSELSCKKHHLANIRRATDIMPFVTRL
jgi:2,3-bisphosphoglycerate-independent phosphoglycerate mutase